MIPPPSVLLSSLPLLPPISLPSLAHSVNAAQTMEVDVPDPPKPNVSELAVTSSASTVPNILDSISIDELFQKLVASGIVPNVDSKSKEEEEDNSTVKPVDFGKPETLKQ